MAVSDVSIRRAAALRKVYAGPPLGNVRIGDDGMVCPALHGDARAVLRAAPARPGKRRLLLKLAWPENGALRACDHHARGAIRSRPVVDRALLERAAWRLSVERLRTVGERASDRTAVAGRRQDAGVADVAGPVPAKCQAVK